MGKYDNAMYQFLDNNERFAELFNAVLFQGRPVIRGEMLQSEDGRYVVCEEDFRGDAKTTNRFRDLKKQLKSGGWLAVTALENQAAVDYAMPWRMLQLDGQEYGKQLSQLRSDKAERLRKQGIRPGGWNTRLSKSDRLKPVYSICFYHGTEPWDGPTSLREMMDFGEELPEWKELFHDYGMTLFCANQVKDITMFHTGLRQVLEVIPCRKDKERLSEVMKQEEYRHLDRDTAETLAVLVDRPNILEQLEEYEKEGEFDMCQAMDELEQDWLNEGIERGKLEGKLEEQERILQLIGRMSAEGDVELILRLSADRGLLQEMYAKYNL